MKKLLLATSALIGAGALVATASAGAPTLSIGGNLDFRLEGGQTQATAGATTEDNGDPIDVGAARNGWNLTRANSRSEIKFRARGESDGGIKYGAVIDYRYQGNSTDESYIFIESGWGRVHLGDDDGALDHRVPNAGSIAPGAYLIDDTTTFINMESNSNSDDTKVTYFTPNAGGFEAAVSIYEQVGIYEDIIEAAISYGGSSGDVSFNVGIGIQSGSVSDSSRINLAGVEVGTADRIFDALRNEFAPVAIEPDSLSEFVVGGTVSFGAISLAASYNSEGDSGTIALPSLYNLEIEADSTADPVVAQANPLSRLSEANRAAIVGQKSEGRELYTLGIAYNLGDGMNVGFSYGSATQTTYQSTLAREEDGTILARAYEADATAIDDQSPNRRFPEGGIVEAEETQTLVALDFGFPILEGMSGYAGIAFSEWERESTRVDTGGINPAIAEGTGVTGRVDNPATDDINEYRASEGIHAAASHYASQGETREATTYVIGTTISF